MIREESRDTEVKCPWSLFVTNTLMSLFGENPKPTRSAPERDHTRAENSWHSNQPIPSSREEKKPNTCRVFLINNNKKRSLTSLWWPNSLLFMTAVTLRESYCVPGWIQPMGWLRHRVCCDLAGKGGEGGGEPGLIPCTCTGAGSQPPRSPLQGGTFRGRSQGCSWLSG